MDYNSVYKEWRKAVDYKTSVGLFDTCRTNEKYYASEHWDDVKAKGLPRPTLNFLSQIVDVKVSTVMANNIMIYRLADELSEENEQVQIAVKAFAKMDEVNWERTKMNKMNEDMLLDSALSGLGISYWYWDNDIRTGNEFKTAGDFKGELIDSIDLSVLNPNENDIQKQEWIILNYKETVSKVKKMAKESGVSEEQVDSLILESKQDAKRFGKEDKEFKSEGSGLVDILVKFWKKDGKVHSIKTTKMFAFGDEINTELELYPIATMQWDRRKKFIYGNAEITNIIKNQQYINKMESIRQLHTILMSAPKLLFDRTKIQGVTNQVGGMHGVNGDITNTMQFVQPKQMTIDVDKAVNNVIELTRQFKGVNENMLGISRPENTSALIAQQKASAVPLESTKRRFYQYLEDVSAIWLDFYKNKYKLARKVLSKGEDEVIEFTGTNFKDVYMRTKVDIGTNTQYGELESKEALDMLLSAGHINVVQYLERYPNDNIPKRDELIEELGGSSDIDREFKFEMMARFLDRLDDESKARIMNLPEDQREEAIMRMAMEEDEVQQQQTVGSETRINPQVAGQQRRDNQAQMNRAGIKQNAVTQQQQGLPRNI